MIPGYTAADVRAAEAPLLARGVPLMQHAAFALAGRVAAELGVRRAGTPGGAVRGASVVLLVGAGNNGGDTLHAGALLARRGVRVLAVCATDRPHGAGLDALLRAGGRAARLVDDAGEGTPRHRVEPAKEHQDREDGADEGPDGSRAGRGPAATPAATSVLPAVGGPVVPPSREVRTAAAPGAGVPALPVAGAPIAPRSGGGLAALSVQEAAALAGAADVVLDGLLGIGGRGAPRGAAGLLVERLAALAPGAGPLVVAVDLPSGVGVDDGALPDGPVLPARVTVTFGGAKAGLLLPPGDALAGEVQVVDLGLPLDEVRPAVVRLAAEDVAALWPVPAGSAHKYSRGVLGVVAGTATYPGAAVLAVSAAALAGVGMVRYVGPAAVAQAVLAARPEVVVGSGRVQAWLLGPGVDPQDEVQAARVREALAAALHDGLPTVLDAGALALAPAELAPWVVLTPHAGELATLLAGRGETVDRAAVEAEPLRWARRAHALTGATVLLKGATTVVVGAQGAVYAQHEAPAWLATAGAGDVLAGLLGALLAGRAEDLTAEPTLVAALAAAAASVHGRAAATAVPGGPVTALAVAHALPATVAGVLRG
jgi:ADP-dependent NAD(P)H-hydrate dehydratase / NAD(P)H-hydrate epimerase